MIESKGFQKSCLTRSKLLQVTEVHAMKSKSSLFYRSGPNEVSAQPRYYTRFRHPSGVG
jgi:hypothetical protein